MRFSPAYVRSHEGMSWEIDIQQLPDQVSIVVVLEHNRPLMDIQILDMHGRRIKTLFYGPMPRGRNRIGFDGRDHRGTEVCSRSYLIRVSSGPDVGMQAFNWVR